jgi:hypothetical protein
VSGRLYSRTKEQDARKGRQHGQQGPGKSADTGAHLCIRTENKPNGAHEGSRGRKGEEVGKREPLLIVDPVPVEACEAVGHGCRRGGSQQALENPNDDEGGADIGLDPPTQLLLPIRLCLGPCCRQGKEHNDDKQRRRDSNQGCLPEKVSELHCMFMDGGGVGSSVALAIAKCQWEGTMEKLYLPLPLNVHDVPIAQSLAWPFLRARSESCAHHVPRRSEQNQKHSVNGHRPAPCRPL